MPQGGSQNGPRCVVIGLDGLTWDLLDPWMQAGLLPNLSAVVRRGARGVLQSLELPLSPPAWTSITTGKNPGGHGIFGFVALKPGGYQLDTIDGRACRAPRLWDYIGNAGLKVGVFNSPVTYPPREVNGYLVGCFLTPDVTKTFTYPESLGKELHEVSGGYRTWTSQVFTPGTPFPYVNELRGLVTMRTRVIEHLIRTRPHDFGMFVFMESDWLQHKVWHLLQDPSLSGDELYKAAQAVYVELDKAVGLIMEACGPQCNYVIVSDHGAGFHDRVMHVNKWLYEEGFLVLKNTPRLVVRRFLERRKILLRAYKVMSWLRGRMNWIGKLVPNALANRAIDFFTSFDDVDWSRTRAYSRDAMGQIFVNLKGREPGGIVADGAEYEALLEEIEERLHALPDPRTGKPIVTRIFRGREIYRGPLAGEAADLVLVLDDFRCTCSVRFGFDADGVFSGVEFCDTGTHRPEGIIAACGPDVAAGVEIKRAGVTDVTPTVLRLMGLPIPDGMDGRPLDELLTPAFREAHAVSYQKAGAVQGAEAPYDKADAEMVEKRLQDLGYL